MNLSISPGNTKMGKIPSISLPPVKACGTDVPCKKGCYALKAYRMYKNTRAAWDRNLTGYRNDPDGYFKTVDAWIKAKKPRFFRWHVAGDILDETYLNGMLGIAAKNPATTFLAFTKRADLLPSRTVFDLVPNLTIIYSCWPGAPIPDATSGYRKAWMQDGTEDRVPADTLECPGNCETCGMCFNIKKIGKDVVFHKH